MKTIDRFDTRLSRRSVLRASVYAGAGFTLFAPLGFRASARQDSFNIAFIQGVIGDNFYITMDCGARAKAEALGNITIDTQGPERFDQTLQTPILNAVVQSAPDAIMMAPNDRQGMIAPIQAAIDAGVPVLVRRHDDRRRHSVGRRRDRQCRGRPPRGARSGRADRRGRQGLRRQRQAGHFDDRPARSRVSGRRSRASSRTSSISAKSTATTTRISRLRSRQRASNRIPDLAGIFGTNLFAAQGAAAAVRQQGLQGKVKMVGFDAGPTQVQDLRSEVVDLLIAQHPGDIGEIAVQLLHDFLTTGEPLDPKEFVTGATIVTRDNIEDPEVARYLYVADCANYTLANAEPMPAASPAATPTA